MSVVNRRLNNFRRVLEWKGLDAIVLANFWAREPNHYNYNLYYITNLLNFFSYCFLIITKDNCGVWVSAEGFERAKDESWIKRIEPIELRERRYSTEEFGRIIVKNLEELLGKRRIKVGVDGDHQQSSVILSLIKEGLQIEDVTLDLERSRLIKDEVELKFMRKAAEIVDEGVNKVMDTVHEGVTEYELAAIARCEMIKSGAECFWWKTIVASGPEVELWPNSPTDRKIRKGDVIWMDFTPIYKGYSADIARAFIYGEANKKQLEVFRLAEKTLNEAASTLRNGVTIREVMEAAAQQVRGSPYEKFYVGPGHVIGLYNDVYPVFLTSISKMGELPSSLLDMKLVEGMVVAIEIIFTIPGLGGIRLEDNYLITREQTERLTKAPIKAVVT